MPQVVIENPVINSPFEEPKRCFKFTEDGITDEITTLRRISTYFIPIPKSKKKGPKQLEFETEWTMDRVKENKFINEVRGKVGLWRKGGYTGITPTTRKLLDYWSLQGREHRLFFCQIEAIETIIYLTEVAAKYGDQHLLDTIKIANKEANPKLIRMAMKMATGSGKTLVMAMLIAWHILNKQTNPQDARFSDTFLIVTPGITIRDRLRVLLPSDPQNYYRLHDLVPPDLMGGLGKGKFVITNFHTFKPRETIEAGRLTKGILNQNGGVFTENPGQMVRRVCREFGNKRNIIVINDESHHCYRSKIEEEKVVKDAKLKGDEKKEADKRNEEARIWISGLEAVAEKIGIRALYDLSATPFFLKGSGYKEGTLFPWVVSDFSLIDAIESGIVKVPRVPVSDNAMTGEQPIYRDIWSRIRDELPKRGRGIRAGSSEPKLPPALEGALQSLYDNYQKYYQAWNGDTYARERGMTPPVFIAVCNNTSVSKLVFDYISGWEKQLEDGTTTWVPGKMELFSNVEHNQPLVRPNTILIDSGQLESGEGMTDDYKKLMAIQIEEFKSDYRQSFSDRDTNDLTDEDLLREVMNTVGKSGKLGEHVRCVVSVSMLTEGWDANTVTHILGVRAFGTQLLCEQVVGRGLRRRSYAVSDHVLDINGEKFKVEGFEPEYAEVYGVPFSFIPTSGSTTNPKPPKNLTHVQALEERIRCEITFPRVTGYRYDFETEKLQVEFKPESHYALTTKEIATMTELTDVMGIAESHDLFGYKDRRLQEVDFQLAKLVCEQYLTDGEGKTKPWLFPQVREITREWREKCLTCKDNTFPQLLLISHFQHRAAGKIANAILGGIAGNKTLLPILRNYDEIGSTRFVSFDTAKPVYTTDPLKCHISHVVADTESWEQKVAQSLEEMVEVECYVKNHNLGFTIPYILDGEPHEYIPDYIVKLSLPAKYDGRFRILNLVLEVSGEALEVKDIKVDTARNLWVPAINNYGKFGRWALLEVKDPWDVKNTIKAFIQKLSFS
jgi:type III restriction enzyme